ncbi:hypothetical protein IMSAGC004_03179 [Bacteroidaceae bacterium]|nr:hypothetical protein IMSAGC004_03179 [Bacteroidaceae bacterium]
MIKLLVVEDNAIFATKSTGAWCKVRWNLVQDSMELGAKANGAGCDTYICVGRCLRMCNPMPTYVQAYTLLTKVYC